MDATEAETGVVTGYQEAGGHLLIQSTVYTWEAQLPRILFFNPRRPHVVTSPLIEDSPVRSYTSWRVQASHNCWDSDRRVRTIGLYLWRMSEGDLISQKEWNQLEAQQRIDFIFRIKYKFEILDTEGNPQFTRESDIKFIEDGTAIGGRNFALYDEAVRKKCITVDNTMTVRTTISQFRLLPEVPDIPDILDERITVMFGEEKLGEYNALKLMENTNLGNWAMDTKGNILHAIDLQTILSATPLAEQHAPADLIQTAREMLMFLDEGKCLAVNKELIKKELMMKMMLFKFAQLFCIENLKKICVRMIIEKHLTSTECLRIVRFMTKMQILNNPNYVLQVNQLKAFMRANFEELSRSHDMYVSFTDYSQVYTKLVLEPDL